MYLANKRSRCKFNWLFAGLDRLSMFIVPIPPDFFRELGEHILINSSDFKFLKAEYLAWLPNTMYYGILKQNITRVVWLNWNSLVYSLKQHSMQGHIRLLASVRILTGHATGLMPTACPVKGSKSNAGIINQTWSSYYFVVYSQHIYIEIITLKGLTHTWRLVEKKHSTTWLLIDCFNKNSHS